MEVAPAVKPDTTPVVEATVAIHGLPLVHVPPGVTSLRVVLFPVHVAGEPAIAAGV
jgi:hypothetical protein